jgi:hypothetical protein
VRRGGGLHPPRCSTRSRGWISHLQLLLNICCGPGLFRVRTCSLKRS